MNIYLHYEFSENHKDLCVCVYVCVCMCVPSWHLFLKSKDVFLKAHQIGETCVY